MENNTASNTDQKQISCRWLEHAIGQAHRVNIARTGGSHAVHWILWQFASLNFET